jgi:hypothetical protein
MKPFTTEQKYLITQGDKLTEQLNGKVKQALGLSPGLVEVKRHHWIYSPPGAGKTFTVQTTADKAKVKLLKIQGAASISAIVTQLAVAAYVNKDKPVVVWIDDCDSLFMDSESLNVMKGALDEDRNMMAWNKNMTNQINTYLKGDDLDLLKAEALQHFRPEGSVGIEVPTNNMRFIVTSNKDLTAPNSPKINKSKRLMDEAAIRDRVNYHSFDLDNKHSWGWVASVLLANPILNITDEQKHDLLDWMFINWTKLAATSMRAVKELAADMINHPDSYPDHWQLKLMR